MNETGPLNPTPPPVSPSDFPTSVPSDYIPPPTPSEGPLGSLRSFIQGTVDPMLGTARDTVGDLVKNALPILSPPAVQAGQGPLGGNLLRGAVDLVNPIPRDTSDLLRDAAFMAIPGSGGIRSALRVGGGTAGAMAGANLGGTSEGQAAATSIPGLILGESIRGVGGNIGREKRQSVADAQNVSKVMNAADPDLALPGDVQGLYQKAFAPKGKGNINDVTVPRYQAMLDTVEQRMSDPDRILITLPNGQPATFREAMDYIMRNGNTGTRTGPLSESPKNARQQAMDTIKVREGVIEALKDPQFPQDNALAPLVQDESKLYFIDKTARRLLRSPGVLNKDTGIWDMRAAQEAFHKQLAKEMIPPDVYADFQAAFYRGSKPPLMDAMGGADPLTKGLFSLGGAIASPTHPWMGAKSGAALANRMSPNAYVGQTVGPNPLGVQMGVPVSLGSAQSLKELLSGLQ